MSQHVEIKKFLNVLEQIETTVSQSDLGEDPKEVVRFCVARYNKIFDRLKEVDTEIETVFDPLEESTRPEVIAMACRQMISWFDDSPRSGWEHVQEHVFDPENFSEFWRRSGKDLKDLGENIRQTIEMWSGKFPEAHMRRRDDDQKDNHKPSDD